LPNIESCACRCHRRPASACRTLAGRASSAVSRPFLAGRGALQSENFNVYLAIVRPLVIVILALALV
jgi:hypothetical protein